MELTFAQKYYRLTYNIRMLPYNIKNYCKNLYRYRKTLWNSRPWDYQGIYLALHDQLTCMSTAIEKHGHHTDKERVVKDMRICIKLLDRLMEDDYSKMNYDWDESGIDGELRIKVSPHVLVPYK